MQDLDKFPSTFSARTHLHTTTAETQSTHLQNATTAETQSNIPQNLRAILTVVKPPPPSSKLAAGAAPSAPLEAAAGPAFLLPGCLAEEVDGLEAALAARRSSSLRCFSAALAAYTGRIQVKAGIDSAWPMHTKHCPCRPSHYRAKPVHACKGPGEYRCPAGQGVCSVRLICQNEPINSLS